MTAIVTCPKHGEHEYVIESNIPGFQGVWCQICWLESLGPSLPYRRVTDTPGFHTMDEMETFPDEEFKTLPKNAPTE
jgi:hypothetical protein